VNCVKCHTPIPEGSSACPSCGEPVLSTDQLAEELRAALGEGYAVERALGAGGFAVVYLVRDLNLKRKLAVKVLSPDLITSKTVLERFRREAETVAQLSHPHIVPLHFIGQKGDLLYLAMECIEGGSLADRIDREGRLPVDEAARILSEVASALDYAHKRGVVHRDIKPHNILLEAETGRSLLTDFGIARTAEGGSLTATGMVVGTPAYLAPEQVTGEPSDHRADIYALGVVAYEMLAGQPPFTGPTPTAVLLKRLGNPPPPLAGIRADAPPELIATIEGMLQPDPAQRFQSAAEVVRALRGGQPAPGRPATSALRPRSPTRRGLAAAVLGTLGLVLAVALAWALTHRSRPVVVAPVDPDMVVIAGGDYTIGSNQGHPYASPAHKVTVKPFGIDIREVSVAEYAAFVNSGRAPAPWTTAPDSLLPVTGVTYTEAMSYCAWRHQPDGRLPTEVEWEAAARGLAGREFPWGSAWVPAAANTQSAGQKQPARVGSYPRGATPEGVHDLVGNVWEWTMTPMSGYPGHSLPDSMRRYFVIRGGAFDTADSLASVTYRGYQRPETPREYLSKTGFRCVMPVREPEPK
jgi:formylglycine-generating enzyme required for sulfatase activity/tRNA A-37 threonylcarbamoyl transferase component Bud32